MKRIKIKLTIANTDIDVCTSVTELAYARIKELGSQEALLFVTREILFNINNAKVNVEDIDEDSATNIN